MMYHQVLPSVGTNNCSHSGKYLVVQHFYPDPSVQICTENICTKLMENFECTLASPRRWSTSNTVVGPQQKGQDTVTKVMQEVKLKVYCSAVLWDPQGMEAGGYCITLNSTLSYCKELDELDLGIKHVPSISNARSWRSPDFIRAKEPFSNSWSCPAMCGTLVIRYNLACNLMGFPLNLLLTCLQSHI